MLKTPLFIFFKKTLAFIFFFSYFFYSCSHGKNEKNHGSSSSSEGIDHYIDSLPENESINASLLNYEYLSEKLKNNIQNQEYLLAISNAFIFFEIFEEEDDRGYVNFYLHQAISSLSEEAKQNLSKNTSREQRKLIHLVKHKGQFVYNNGLLQQQLEKRVGYVLEMKAAEELYLSKLTQLKSDERDRKKIDEALNVLEFFFRRFPSSERAYNYAQTITNASWTKILSKKKYSELTNWIEHINAYQYGHETTVFSYLHGHFITLRNKTNYLLSRKVYSFDGWEEVEVLKKKSNYVNTNWVQVRFGEHIGFLEKKYLNSIEVFPREKIYFREALSQYLQKNYIKAAQLTAKCIRKSKSLSIKERAVLLLEHCHRNIAERATSKTSPFLQYVRQYPRYFKVTKDDISLGTSLILFDFLRDINDNSEFLAYFFKSEES